MSESNAVTTIPVGEIRPGFVPFSIQPVHPAPKPPMLATLPPDPAVLIRQVEEVLEHFFGTYKNRGMVAHVESGIADDPPWVIVGATHTLHGGPGKNHDPEFRMTYAVKDIEELAKLLAHECKVKIRVDREGRDYEF